MNLIGVVMFALGKVILCLQLPLSLYYVTVNRCVLIFCWAERDHYSMSLYTNAPFPTDWKEYPPAPLPNDLTPDFLSNLRWRNNTCCECLTQCKLATSTKMALGAPRSKAPMPKMPLPAPKSTTALGISCKFDRLHAHSQPFTHGNLPRFWKHLSALAKGTVFTCFNSFTLIDVCYIWHMKWVSKLLCLLKICKRILSQRDSLQKDALTKQEIVLSSAWDSIPLNICIWRIFSACWSMPISQQAAVSPSVAYLRFMRLMPTHIIWFGLLCGLSWIWWIGLERHSC